MFILFICDIIDKNNYKIKHKFHAFVKRGLIAIYGGIVMTRKEAREQAFIMVFEKEFNSEYTLDEIVETAKDADLFEADEFAKTLADKTLETMDKLDEVITSHLKEGWRISRISKVSLAILRLAVCELMYFSDIPVSVTINEAVELAKTYAAEKDSAFVNGLLASVSKSVAAADE